MLWEEGGRVYACGDMMGGWLRSSASCEDEPSAACLPQGFTARARSFPFPRKEIQPIMLPPEAAQPCSLSLVLLIIFTALKTVRKCVREGQRG